MKRKLANALLGLAAGIVTAPIAMLAWPFYLAWFMWNESEGFDI